MYTRIDANARQLAQALESAWLVTNGARISTVKSRARSHARPDLIVCRYDKDDENDEAPFTAVARFTDSAE